MGFITSSDLYRQNDPSSDGYESEGLSADLILDSDFWDIQSPLANTSTPEAQTLEGRAELLSSLGYESDICPDEGDTRQYESDTYPCDEEFFADLEEVGSARAEMNQTPSMEESAQAISTFVPCYLQEEVYPDPAFNPHLEYLPQFQGGANPYQFDLRVDPKKQHLVLNQGDVLKELANLPDGCARDAIRDAAMRARETGEAQFIQRKEFNLPRSLIVTASGDIYVLFNRKKQGDGRLGKGHFKNVYAALHLNTGTMLAFLSMKKDAEHPDANQREFELSTKSQLGTISNSFIDRGTKTAWLGKVMDGDIDAAVSKGLIAVGTESQRFELALQMLDQLSNFHEQGIIHMDVKPANFLYSNDAKANVNVILGDMGLAIQKGVPVDRIGALFYLSPESVYTNVYNMDPSRTSKLPFSCGNEQHDSWSMGMSLLRLFNRHLDLVDNPKLSALLLARSEDERVKLIFKYWYHCGLTQEEWMKEPQNKVSLEFVIWNLLKVDPMARWTPRQAAEYIRFLQSREEDKGSTSSPSSSSYSPMAYCDSPRMSPMSSSSSPMQQHSSLRRLSQSIR